MENQVHYYVAYKNGTHRSYDRGYGFRLDLDGNENVTGYAMTCNSTGKQLMPMTMKSNAIKEYLSAIGSKGGSARTAAKAKASAENGKKGGRPKAKKD